MCNFNVTDSGFTPIASTSAAVQTTSANLELPGIASYPTKVRVTNLGQNNVFVALGDSTVEAAIGTSLIVLPNTSIVLAIGSNNYIGFIADASFDGIYLTTGV